MDKKTLRKLNRQLSDARARLDRATLAKEVAGMEVRHLENSLREKLSNFMSNLTDPLYDVYVAGFESPNPNKIGCIKAVRELSSLGLKEAKDVVDAVGSPTNSTFLKGVNFTTAERARKMVSEHGYRAELRSAQ